MRLLVICAVLSSWASAASATQIYCDGQEENLNRYLALFETLFLERDGSRAGEFYADEFITYNSDAGGAGRLVGTPQQLERMFSASKKASPDRTLVNDLIICKDDIVSTRMTVTGTQTGVMMGAPATGRTFRFTAMDIFRFKDGKVVERWGNADHLALIRQLGLEVDLSPTELDQ